jgi:DNA/RNA endonuclease G (NUC1)
LKRDWRREIQKRVLEINPERIQEEIAIDLCTPDNNNTHTQNNMRVPTHFYKQIYMPAMVR